MFGFRVVHQFSEQPVLPTCVRPTYLVTGGLEKHQGARARRRTRRGNETRGKARGKARNKTVLEYTGFACRTMSSKGRRLSTVYKTPRKITQILNITPMDRYIDYIPPQITLYIYYNKRGRRMMRTTQHRVASL